MQIIKKLSATFIFILSSFFAIAEETATKPKPQSSSFDVDTVLVICIGILAIVIISLANTLLFAMKFHKKGFIKSSSANTTKTLMFIACMFISAVTIAQATDSATPAKVEAPVEHIAGFRMLLYAIIIVELAVIFALNWMVKLLLKPNVDTATATEAKPVSSFNLKKIWNKLNKFKPIEEEASIDTGHSYDGIHELNNITPPWFTVAFLLSIVFAIVYLYRYHVAHSAPLPEQEYAIEMQEAEQQHAAYLKTQKNLIDENTVTMLGADGIAAGKVLYETNCFACHGKEGQGGVGPNLTDDYWLHGGSIHDVFKSIKYGWKDKGMQSWESIFSPAQIQQIASFIKSMHGTKPAGAKEPQGELYVETKDANTSTAAKDSSANKQEKTK
ncbi:MAG: c-type cytochrome [Bacteroidetes bacterium]|nr:c-type cytochrome [Bacteroidota bacterium]MBS1650262.1 c-type cytochrome [Bacteroidota bacterium]